MVESTDEKYVFHVLEEDFIPVIVAVFDSYDEASAYVVRHQDQHRRKLYVVQRLARFSYR